MFRNHPYHAQSKFKNSKVLYQYNEYRKIVDAAIVSNSGMISQMTEGHVRTGLRMCRQINDWLYIV
jgi:hypothetical protein